MLPRTSARRPPMVAGQGSTFSTLLRRHRLALGLTQEELAERAGLSPRVISEIERGGPHTPRRDTVALLAAALALEEPERAAFAAAARPLRAAAPRPAPADPALGATLPPLVGRGRQVGLLERHLGG